MKHGSARHKLLPLAALFVADVAPALAAEMGRAPISSGTFATIEGGYTYRSGEDAIGHALVPTGIPQDPAIDTFISAEQGWHAGASLGIVAHEPLIAGLPFTRAEAYFTFATVDDSNSSTIEAPGAISLKSVDGSALAVEGTNGKTSQEVRTYDGGVRFAFDQAASARSSLSWVLTPFVRNTEEETRSFATGTADFAGTSADVSSWSYGAMLAVEPEIWLTSAVALVGRVGAGIYGYHAEGDFTSASSESPDPFAANVSDDASGVGFRGQLGAGVKVRVAPGATLTGYAETDYFSAVGTANLPDNQFSTLTTSSIDMDDAWELRAGARFSIGLAAP